MKELITQSEAARLKKISRQRIHTLLKMKRLTNYEGKVDKNEVLNLVPQKPGKKAAK